MQQTSRAFHHRILIIAALVASATTAACGGDSNSSSDGGFWPDTYNAAGLPTPAAATFHNGTNPGACMPCHNATGAATLKIAYGGVVFKADGVTRAANVEVGVSDGTSKSFVYSGTDGLYWAPASQTVNWATADIRVRTATGEAAKAATDARDADCDSCHKQSGGTATALKAP